MQCVLKCDQITEESTNHSEYHHWEVAVYLVLKNNIFLINCKINIPFSLFSKSPTERFKKYSCLLFHSTESLTSTGLACPNLRLIITVSLLHVPMECDIDTDTENNLFHSFLISLYHIYIITLICLHNHMTS